MDETTDDRERQVSNVFLKYRNKFFLVETEMTDGAVNYQSRLVNGIVQKLEIHECNLFYITDNTGYMKKRYERVLKSLYPKMVWISRGNHILD